MDHPRQRRVVKGFIVACPSRERQLTGGATPSETTCTAQIKITDTHVRTSMAVLPHPHSLVGWTDNCKCVFVKGFLISGGRRGTIFCKKKGLGRHKSTHKIWVSVFMFIGGGWAVGHGRSFKPINPPSVILCLIHKKIYLIFVPNFERCG